MSDTTSAGQAAPVVIDTTATTEAAQTNAATTDPATGAGEGGEASQAAPAKTFTQSELDDIVRREKSKAEAKAERRVLRTLEKLNPAAPAAPAAPSKQADNTPRRDQFASDEDYLDAKVEWKLNQREQHSAQERQKEQAQGLAKKTDAIYAQAQSVAGFDREAFDELPLTKPIVEALIDSDQAPQLMAYMAAHPDDVARIAGMSPARQAAELGKLEAKLEAKPPVKPSKAPDPITNPIGNGKTPVVDLQTADHAKYRELRKQQGARWAK